MNKLFKNKKIVISLAVAFIIAASSATYAWFTSNASVDASIGLGTLKVTAKMFEEYTEDATGDLLRVYPGLPGYTTPDPADFTPTQAWFEENVWYQPGQEGITAFEVANPATAKALSLTVKLNGLGGTVTLYCDADGNELPTPVEYGSIAELLIDYPGAIVGGVFDEISATPGTFIYVDAAGEYLGSVAWFFDQNTFANEADATEFYVMITPGMSFDYATEMAYVGDAMGNEFQGAEFEFNSAFLATQVLDDAIAALWGPVHLVAFQNFEVVPLGAGGLNSTQSFSARTSQFASFTVEEALRFAFPERY